MTGAPEPPGTGRVGRADDRAQQAEAIGAEWDRRYGAAETPRLFRAEPDESLVELVAPLAPGTALDLGAGEGRNSLWLAAAGWEVTAVDASGVALGRLREAADAAEVGRRVETVRSDIVTFADEHGAPGSQFDLVLVCFVHPEPTGRPALLAAAAGAVAPGGHLLVVGHHRDSFGISGPPDAARLYVEADFDAVAPELAVLRVGRRLGHSDVETPATDIVFFARRAGAAGS